MKSTSHPGRRRSEEALLLACAGAINRGETVRVRARECRDWAFIIQAANRHGITALVSSRLSAVAADAVPTECLLELSGIFRANALRNLFLTQELLSLLREFGAHGIVAIPMKGPILAIAAYGNVALREFLDLDILIPKHHLEQAGKLLTRLGYVQSLGQCGPFSANHVEAQLGCDFLRKDRRVSVELHWSFLQRWLGFEVEMEAVWQQSQYVSVGGTEVLTLPCEISLLYLCVHGTKHRWSRLCWVVDVAHWLRSHPGLKWAELLEIAKRSGSRRTLFLGLHLARQLLGSELPATVMVEMRKDTSATALAEALGSRLFAPEAQASPKRQGLGRDWFYIQTKERWRDRCRYLRYALRWFLLPSQKDKDWIRLPASLRWLYVFLRPLRVACAVVRPGTQRVC